MVGLDEYIFRAGELIGENSRLLNRIKLDNDLHQEAEKLSNELDNYVALISGKPSVEVYAEIGFDREDLLSDYRNPIALAEAIDFAKDTIDEMYLVKGVGSTLVSYAKEFAKKAAPALGVAIPLIVGSALIITPVYAGITVNTDAEVYGTYDQHTRSTPGTDVDSTSNITCFGNAEVRNNGVVVYESSGVKNVSIDETGNVIYNPAVYFRDGKYGVDEIAAALADGDAKEFIHPINGETAVYENPQEALNATFSQIEYCSDDELYGSREAWANPKMTRLKKAGDCEDSAFFLASIDLYNTKDNPAAVYTQALTFTPDPANPDNVVGHMNVIYFDDGTWIAQEPTAGFYYDATKYGLPNQKSLYYLSPTEVILA